MKKKEKEAVRLTGGYNLCVLSENDGCLNFPDCRVFSRFPKGIPECLRQRQKSRPTPAAAVLHCPLEISDSQSFPEVIAALKRPLPELTLTVSQVVDFCERYEKLAFKEKVATIFFAECGGKIKALVVGQENGYRGVLAYPAVGKRKRTDENYTHYVVIPEKA